MQAARVGQAAPALRKENALPVSFCRISLNRHQNPVLGYEAAANPAKGSKHSLAALVAY
ncbi:hypothetical protein EMIT0373P_10687 [Pseudomonas chlororaphis]